MSNPKINTAFTFNTALFKNGDIVVNPTLAAGDVTVHTADTDKGNIDTLPSVLPSSQESVKVPLSADEMNGAYLAIIFIDQTSPKEWDDLYISIETSANTVDEIKAETVLILADTADIQPNFATSTALATVDSNVDAILIDTAEIGTAGAGLTAINLPNQTMDITGNITGNLSGSVGSVTGAVGSVSGNVDGNVTGSVGSLTGHTVQTGDTFAIFASATGTSDSGGTTTMVDSVRTEINDHWNGGIIVFGSGGSANNVGVSRLITDFVASSDTLTFTPAVLTAITTETYTIIPGATVNLLVATQTSIDAIETDTNSLNDTKIPNTLNTTASGNIGIDWANVENPTTTLNLSGTNIDVDQIVASVSGNVDGNVTGSVGSVTGHTNQTGDSFAVVNSGTFGNAQLVRSTTPANALDVSAGGEAGLDWANIGSPTTAQNLSGTNIDVDQIVASVSGNVDGNVTGSVASNLELGPSEVNTEVSDVMKTDTIAERSSGAPTSTPTFEEAISYLYMMLTNKIDVDSGFKEFNNNAGTVIWKKALSDDASNYVEANGESGP